MATFHILYLVFVMTSTAEHNGMLMSRSSKLLHSMCPGAVTCENQTNFIENVESWFGFMSCCNVLECSCRQDCHNANNCCFPLYHHSSTNSDKNVTINEINHSCLFLTTVTPHEGQLVYYKKYKMITSVKPIFGTEKLSAEVQCGSKNVAPWGSLFPVFSRRKGKLYKNSACATLDGSSDVIYFDVYRVCNDHVPHEIDLGQYLEGGWTKNNSFDQCFIEFRYPGNVNELKWHTCFNAPINSCPASFTMRTEHNLNLTQTEIVTTCERHIQSPTFPQSIYANVFCHVCTREFFNEDLTCKVDNMNRGGLYKHTVLMDTNFISNFRTKDLEEKTQPKACLIDHDDDCRLVHCPAGQLYDHAGRCNYPSKLWFNQLYSIALNLTTIIPITESELQFITNNLLKGNFILHSPLPKQWYFSFIYFLLPISNQKYCHLHVICLHKFYLKVRPLEFLSTVKKVIHREWSLVIANTTFVFASKLSRFYSVGNHELDSQNIFFSRYKQVYHALVDIRGTLTKITKLYFCNQIELALDEFIVESMNILISNFTSSRYLFASEFQVYMSINGKETARICVEDSRFIELVVNSAIDSFESAHYFCLYIFYMMSNCISFLN